MLLTALRDAPWLNRRRVGGYAALLIAAYFLVVAWILAGPGRQDPLGEPKGTDFVSFWTVSAALQNGNQAAIYHPKRLLELEHLVTGEDREFFAWAYPPTMLLIVYPLALLPYLWSLITWLALTLAFYLRTFWRIIPHPLALRVGLAFPAVFVTLIHGQNGLLIAGLFGSGMSLLPRNAWLSGMLLGLLAIKPHLALLIPIALAAGGFWRAAGGAALSAAALIAFATMMFGGEIWWDFIASTPLTREMLEQGLVPYFKFQSAFAAIRLLGGSLPAAYGAQAVIAGLAAALAAWVWRQSSVEQSLKNAVLAAAAPLATPFVFDYDLTLLALSGAWLAALQMRTEILPWEKSVLAAIFLAPLIARPLANLTGVIVTPLIEMALLAVLYNRCRTATIVASARSSRVPCGI